MKDDKKTLPKNKTNDSKPVQEDKPSSQQKPMGDEQDLEKRVERLENSKDGKDTNSVGIKK